MQDIPSGVWKHFKGFYVVVFGIARHSETEEKFVVYTPLKVMPGPRITIRPLEMFLDEVNRNGKVQKRFTYVGAEMPEELVEG